MQGDYVAIHVLVRNWSIKEYMDHDGHVFVEGRPGSKFSVEVRNVTGRSVKVVVSVDGLSVNTGEPAAVDAADGIWIRPYGVRRYLGIARGECYDDFVFAKKDDVGVIGCAVFVGSRLTIEDEPREILTLYYDDERGLKRRSIDVRKHVHPPIIDPFPASS